MKKKPNVLLISIDTLRADHLTCSGYHRDTTPALDRLAGEGVLFEKAYSTAGWTPPAHASMLTGVYPSQHQVVDKNRLGSDIPTLAQLLLDHGYRTVGLVNNSQVGKLVGLDRGHETFHEVWQGTPSKTFFERGARFLRRKIEEWRGANDYGTARTNHLAMEWLIRHTETDRPFYMFIHYIEPHNPICAPYPYRYKYLKQIPKTVNMEKVWTMSHNPLIAFTDDIHLSQEEIAVLVALYDGEIAYTDVKVGELLEFLRKLKLYDDTLIIITADHGEHFGEHELYSHVASLYEPVAHIPLIIKYPREFSHSGRHDGLVQLTDIVPTAISVTEITSSERLSLPGKALVPHHGKLPSHDYVVAEWEGRIPYYVEDRLQKRGVSLSGHPFSEAFWMVGDGSYKYFQTEHGQRELYNLSVDREETNNIIHEQPGVAERFKKALDEWKLEIRNQTFQGLQYSMDEATRKNLESLGYM